MQNKCMVAHVQILFSAVITQAFWGWFASFQSEAASHSPIRIWSWYSRVHWTLWMFPALYCGIDDAFHGRCLGTNDVQYGRWGTHTCRATGNSPGASRLRDSVNDPMWKSLDVCQIQGFHQLDLRAKRQYPVALNHRFHLVWRCDGLLTHME